MSQLTGGLWEAGLRSGTALGARDRARRHLGQFGTYAEHESRPAVGEVAVAAAMGDLRTLLAVKGPGCVSEATPRLERGGPQFTSVR